MRTLVYKRTHSGDPDEQGRFGIHDCMKTVRAWNYEAVIGVGGIGAEPRQKNIAGKLTWVGISPHKAGRPDRPLVTFDHFLYFGEAGPLLGELAPVLAKRVYGRHVRTAMSFSPQEQREVEDILALARNAPPSPALNDNNARAKTPCRTGTWRARAADGPADPLGGRVGATTSSAPASSRTYAP